METPESLKNYFDEENKLKIYPAKRTLKDEFLRYVTTKFQKNQEYTERDVNTIIQSNICFADYAIIRRELIESKLLERTDNCKTYWVK